MNLFSESGAINLLPFDGVVLNHGIIFNHETSQKYFHTFLNEIDWRQDEVLMFGKKIITKRKAAWYAEDGLEYIYSGSKKKGLPFTQNLLQLKSEVENITQERYNSCLLNLYHDGEEGMGWHSDDEKTIVPESSIASVSFGAERKFTFKHKENKQSISLALNNGSLLEMKGKTQEFWWHSLPKSKKVKAARINLTFRKMIT
ncbi:MAG: alpha-ketoglutarate-dependent dioxygenase AlkB [Sphingobacteriales bacterium]|nr:alpha-ketoglutarate-dependent dioxygenase AlkB [Sphingobacteriales bacterium]